MDFNSLVTPRLQYSGTLSASDFEGIARAGGYCGLLLGTTFSESTTNLDASGEKRLAERRRIAQELHHRVLLGFLAASMKLRAAVDRFSAERVGKPRSSDVLQLADSRPEHGRSAPQGLRSPNNRIESLGEAFAHVPKDLWLPSTVGFRVVVHGRERALRAGLRDEIYRIGREAIVNAYRHSRARFIETEIEYQPTELRITVRDNGCGISPQDLRWGQNRYGGLQGMRERAERIGARLRLWSRVALGTEVELCIPGRVTFESVAGRAAL